MASVQIPLSASTNQTFTTTVPIGSNNVTLNLTLTWNDSAGYWFLTVADSYNNTLIDGVPLITGDYPAANILRQYQYLGIGSCYLLPLSSASDDNPSFDNLSTNYAFIWSDQSLT